MPALIKRRLVLFGGLGVVAAAGAGLSLVSMSRADDAIARTLERLLGHLNIPEPDLARFTADYLDTLRERGIDRRVVRVLGLADPVLRQPTVRALLPERLRDRIERYERHLLTSFTLSTTFFSVGDPHHDPIEYLGAGGACDNPFARFS